MSQALCQGVILKITAVSLVKESPADTHKSQIRWFQPGTFSLLPLPWDGDCQKHKQFANMSSLPYIMVFYRTNVGEPRINKKGKKKVPEQSQYKNTRVMAAVESKGMLTQLTSQTSALQTRALGAISRKQICAVRFALAPPGVQPEKGQKRPPRLQPLAVRQWHQPAPHLLPAAAGKLLLAQAAAHGCGQHQLLAAVPRVLLWFFFLRQLRTLTSPGF